MAHADYHCCARCDRKLDYAGAGTARTKQDLCAECVRALHFVTGELIADGADLLALIQRCNTYQVTALGISRCFYRNPVDDAVAAAGATFAPSWIEQAVALTREPVEDGESQ